MPMTTAITIHLSAVLAATAIGPVVLWTRLGRTQHTHLHRAFGYAWVTLMLVTALSALFIRNTKLPNIAGFTPIHLLVPLTAGSLALAFWFLSQRNITGHRRTMQWTYVGACLVAGVFTLLPSRTLGRMLWPLLLHA